VKEVLDQANAIQAGPYLTGHTYQFTADIAAVGHHGRISAREAGFRRQRRHAADSIPSDLTGLGWALGRQAREACSWQQTDSMITLLRKKRLPTTVLGLALNGSRLEGAVVRRSNGSLQAQKAFAAALALNPLTAEPELVGREIRNHLEQAGIRERRCVVCLPLSWALVLQTDVPDLPEEDIASFLQIEAERGFHYGSEALSTASSRCCSSTGKRFATQVAISRNHLTQLEKVLKAAQLRPISFTLGIAALQSPERILHGVMALLVGESSVDLQVSCGGGILLLRTLDGVFETEGVQPRLSPELLLREIKITLGQLPAEFRDAVRKVAFGHAESPAIR
jgi:hypothetical protein